MKKVLLYPALAFMALLIVACSGSTDSPEGITKHFIESTYKGDGEALIKALDLGKDGEDPTVQQMVAGKMGMAAQEAKKTADENGGVSSINIKDVKYTNDDKTRATVNFIVKFKKNGTEDVGNMNTIKTDKGWKISL